MLYEKKTAGIYTLGCKVNQYESEAIAEELAKNGVTVLPPTEVCDAYIINTCTVTAESDRKARQFIRRAIAKNPEARIVVTGCLAQTAPRSVAAIDGVDAVIGNVEKLAAAQVALTLLNEKKKNGAPKIEVEDINVAVFEQMRISSFGRTRAYIKIEDGCENRCAYCIIPSARGKIRSKAPEAVLEEIRALTENGCREVVLTGIETASYGKDRSDTDLGSLLAQVDKIEGIGRVRLGSLDPSLIRPDFVERIASLSSLAPHFHLSLQSGSSRILAKMKRKYNAEQAMNAIRSLRAAIPNVKFTTDVIVGFPSETEEDFAETLRFCEEARFLMVHIFPYSKREGTLAAAMAEQVPAEVKRQRLHRLEARTKEIRRELLTEAIASSPVTEVLFETYENGYAYGHTADFLEVAVPSDAPLHGRLGTVCLQALTGDVCHGRLMELLQNERNGKGEV